MKILVVDDNRDGADMLALLVQMWGHQTATAYDGASALEVADAFQPDVVLLDLATPDVTGFEVARQLHSKAEHASVHLVAVSGYGRPKDRVEAYRAGFEALIVKPGDEDYLKRLL